ncbi:MAG: hypothetical protein IKT89_07190, partial [Clostridia bacterium]|nr:hypothetical protein [Clostridia bacterium]
VTEVNFDNFADIKSTLSHFNAKLYSYVTGGNREKENWLSQTYVDKYAGIKTILDKYHVFSESDGEKFTDFGFLASMIPDTLVKLLGGLSIFDTIYGWIA